MKHIFIVVLALLTIKASAQDHDHDHQSENHIQHEHGKHKLSFYTGFTHIPSAFYEHETHIESTGKWVPTVGLDYYYTLNPNWEIGLLGDVELDQYYIKTGSHEELERNNVVVLAAVAKYKPTKRIGLIVGPGYEWEVKKNDIETFWVIKAGVEYEVAIEKGWELTPMISYDFKEEYSAYAFGLSIGKRF